MFITDLEIYEIPISFCINCRRRKCRNLGFSTPENDHNSPAIKTPMSFIIAVTLALDFVS